MADTFAQQLVDLINRSIAAKTVTPQDLVTELTAVIAQAVAMGAQPGKLDEAIGHVTTYITALAPRYARRSTDWQTFHTAGHA